MRKEDTFMSDADGLQISRLTLTPDSGEIRAVVQLTHGMSENKERYIPFMEFLNEAGIACVIHDHRGHGKSVRDPEDLGFWYGGGGDALVRDMEHVNRDIHAAWPGVPVILLGHSMGSLAVRAFTARHDDCIDGLLVIGNVASNPALGLARGIAKTEGFLCGVHHRSKTLASLSFSSYEKRFKDREVKAWICSDPEVVREYAASPLCGFTFTVDGYLGLFDLMKEAYDTDHFVCTKKNMPICFLSGEEDPCTVDQEHFDQSVQAMRTAGYRNIQDKLYPAMRHEILNEIGKEAVWQDVLQWLQVVNLLKDGDENDG